MKKIGVAIAGLVSLLYLINPTAGFLEFIPDNLPIIGNLDEGAAMAILLSALRYFGLDWANLFHDDKKVTDTSSNTIHILDKK